MATHYHPDHAGLVQDIKNADAKLIVIRHQQPLIPMLKKLVKPGNSYIDILDTGNIIVPVGESRLFLQQIGINGQVVATPSHSQDSISLVLDTGEAFIGDLAPAFIAGEEGNPAQMDWNLMYSMGVKKVYPGHAAPYTL